MEDRSFIFLLFPNMPPQDPSLLSSGLSEARSSGAEPEDSTDMSDEDPQLRAKPDGWGDAANLLQEEMEPVRVPFRSVVIGLLANQVLLQTIGSILVQGSKHIIPSLANVLMQGVDFQNSSSDKHTEKDFSPKPRPNKPRDDAVGSDLPGLLENLQSNQIMCLLATLDLSYSSALQFDSRPGLKFLIQKVAVCGRAANLYRQAGASWTLRAVALIHLVLHASGTKEVTGDHGKKVLEQDIRHTNPYIDIESNEGLLNDSMAQHRCASNISGEQNSDRSSSMKPERPSTLLDKGSILFIKMLAACFKELCDVYLDLMGNKGRRESEIDEASGHQPFFFVSVKADEFPTKHRKTVDDWTNSLNEFDKKFMQKKCFQDDEKETADFSVRTSVAEDMNDDLEDKLYEESEQQVCETVESDNFQPNYDPNDPAIQKKEEEIRKPFMLADFVQDGQLTDSDESDDSSLPEYWTRDQDSGVASVPGE